MSTDEVQSVGTWRTNADMIADVARLGYGLDGDVFDATYGEGAFWRVHRPPVLVTNDLYKPADHAWDFTNLPLPDAAHSCVVFDPPYKLNGTSQLTMDHAYGVERKRTLDEQLALIVDGAVECFRVSSRWLLVKCQDQVCAGEMRWQTDMVTNALVPLGARKVDRFEFPQRGIPQPPGRRQRTARHSYSQLLVFKKQRRAPGGRVVSTDLRDEIARLLADRGPHRWDWLNEEARDRYRADADAVLAVAGKAGAPGGES